MRIRPMIVLVGASLGLAGAAIAIVLLTRDEGKAARAAGGPSRGELRVERHFALSPVLRLTTSREGGTAFIVRSEGESRTAVVIRARLRPSGDGMAYQAWLYNSIGDAQALGALEPTRTRLFQTEAPLPPGYSRRWRYLDISRERAVAGRRAVGHPSGESVLRGKLRTR